MTRKMVYRCSAILVSLSLLAAACTSDDSSGGDEDEPAPGRTTLEIGMNPPNDLNPFTANTSETAIFKAIFLPLIQVNNENEIFSQILESWEVSEDAKTITLRLRPDIEWSDGTPMTSSDVVMSLTQYLDPNVSVSAGQIGGVVGQQAFTDGAAKSISGLSAPDDHTVVVELEEPDAAWLPVLAAYEGGFSILPYHILGDVSHDELGDHEFFQTLPVASGPYRFVEYVDEQYLELERNPNWSLGESGFERIFFKYISADVTSTQLEAGEVQLIGGVEPADVDRIDSIDGVEIQTTTGAAPALLSLMHYEPLLDPRVRQAMIYAIDREGICEDVLQGNCSVPLTNIRQIAPEWAIPTEDMIEYRYDPARARELLDEAGWDPNTELTLHNPARGESTALEIAQGNMADVGINWTIESVDPGVMLEAIEQGGDVIQGFALGGGDFTADPAQVQVYTECDTHYPDGGNTTHYCDPELDELWKAGRQTTDQEERAEIYHEAFRRLNRNPADIYLYVEDNILAHDSRLKGVKVHPTAVNLWNVGEWTWEE